MYIEHVVKRAISCGNTKDTTNKTHISHPVLYEHVV